MISYFVFSYFYKSLFFKNKIFSNISSINRFLRGINICLQLKRSVGADDGNDVLYINKFV